MLNIIHFVNRNLSLCIVTIFFFPNLLNNNVSSANGTSNDDVWSHEEWEKNRKRTIKLVILHIAFIQPTYLSDFFYHFLKFDFKYFAIRVSVLLLYRFYGLCTVDRIYQRLKFFQTLYTQIFALFSFTQLNV